MSSSRTVAQPSPHFSVGWRIRIAILTGLLTLLLLLVVGLILDRPPANAQITLIGTGNRLHLLVEGAGGGRVLIGGGPKESELPAALGYQFVPWRTTIDLLLVVDQDDLPGATALVQRGQVREVAVFGVEQQRSAAALAALRAACASQQTQYRFVVAAERIALGTAAQLLIDLVPATDEGLAPRLIVHAGTLHAAVALGASLPATPIAILLSNDQARARALAAQPPSLLIAPTAQGVTAFPGQQLLVTSGQRARLTMTGAAITLRGGTITAESPAVSSR